MAVGIRISFLERSPRIWKHSDNLLRGCRRLDRAVDVRTWVLMPGRFLVALGVRINLLMFLDVRTGHLVSGGVRTGSLMAVGVWTGQLVAVNVRTNSSWL